MHYQPHAKSAKAAKKAKKGVFWLKISFAIRGRELAV
jgi:hypothetical protein